MTLLLTLERGPHPQAVRQMRLEAGQLVIGRSADADWQIVDPELLVSRTHCTISGRPGAWQVTDTSSGGLFVDEARSPLGTGNSAPLRSGMRLRLGDFVVRVDEQNAVVAPSPVPPIRPADPLPPAAPPRAGGAADAPAGFADDDFFAAPRVAEQKPQRPTGLPDPFEEPAAGAFAAAPPPRRSSPAFDDPFSLDPLPSVPRAPAPQGSAFPAFEAERPPVAAPAPHSAPAAGFGAFDDAFAAPAAPAARAAERQPPPSSPSRVPGSDPALREAFLRGLGIDPADIPAGVDPIAEMEAFGREYRLMVDGYMHLLRKRAEEKSNARLAQTIVGATEVNPLKFLPGVDAVLATFLAGRTPGFLPAEAAITGAIRDLAQHHVDTWRGVQGALRRMIDRFDPGALEDELKARSAIETLLAGGRRAKLWELYEQRYREIARNAEARFLGEVGADFRDAYEDKGE